MAYYENIPATQVIMGEIWDVTTVRGVTRFNRQANRPWVQVDATQNLWVPNPLLMNDGSVMIKSELKPARKPKKKTNK